jgi:ABC-type multidrug transport system ATPase subunit
MFEIAGHSTTFEDIKGRTDNWYQQWTMTEEQNKEWRDELSTEFEKRAAIYGRGQNIKGINENLVELVEEFTATEQFEFQAQFKPIQKDLSTEKILELIGLKNAAHKQIRYYSSGMKQRLKLALAIFSDCPILLLDEPCSNLDKEGYALYDTLIKEYAMHKLIIVGSNDPAEYHFCKAQVNLMDYKLD